MHLHGHVYLSLAVSIFVIREREREELCIVFSRSWKVDELNGIIVDLLYGATSRHGLVVAKIKATVQRLQSVAVTGVFRSFLIAFFIHIHL